MKSTTKSPSILLRRMQVESAKGLRRSAVYALINQGCFPPPVKISARAVAWRSDEINTWIKNRIVTVSKKTTTVTPNRLELLSSNIGLPGHQIQQLGDGYLVFRLNLIKYCASFEELLQFSKSMGVAK